MTTANTKKGATSIYIIVFTTLLFSVITLSFVRLMLSESLQTTNYSLTQSAYNSALAGVEDAKILLLKYQNCLSANSSEVYDSDTCREIFDAFAAENSDHDCNIIAHGLGRTTAEEDTETPLSSSQYTNTQESAVIDQAYTCVTINTNDPEYIAKLTASSSDKIVPIRVADGQIDNVNRVKIQWFSSQDALAAMNDGSINYNYTNSKVTTTATNQLNSAYRSNPIGIGAYGETKTAAPLLRVEMMQTGVNFNNDQFYKSVGSASDPRTNRGTITLNPSSDSTLRVGSSMSTHIGSSISQSGGKGFVASAAKSANYPTSVYCKTINNGSIDGEAYACTADIVLPKPVGSDRRNPGNTFLRLSLPYGGPETTASVTLYSCTNEDAAVDSSDCRNVSFSGVQPVIDSTGRANDLFRRVQARVELVNTFFPYPDAALTVYGDDSSVIAKNFWVTQSCHTQNTTWNSSTNTVNFTESDCGGNTGETDFQAGD